MKNENIRIKRVIQRCGCDAILPLALVYIFYIILHGHLSPGGGFQGGVLMVATMLLIYLGHGYDVTCEAMRPKLLRKVPGSGRVYPAGPAGRGLRQPLLRKRVLSVRSAG